MQRLLARLAAFAPVCALLVCSLLALAAPVHAQTPTITSFTPTSGPVGTSIAITGTNLTGASAVTFNSTAATTYTVNSATQITATVPTGATTGTIAVTTPGGTATSSSSFTVTVPAPTITSFSPTSGPVGTSVVITGTNLTGTTVVGFQGQHATSFTVNSSTQITTSVPNGAATGPVAVATPGGTAHSSTNFTVTVAAPTITSFTPTSGPTGTSVTITGTSFTGATAVTFNGTAATTFSVVSATSITATVPTGATTGTIAVTTPGGTATSSSNFTVTVPAPTITGFSPTSGPVGTTVVITGTNFTGTTVVGFQGQHATSFTVNSSTQITTSVPNGAATGPVAVATPGGTAHSSASFTVTTGGNAPTITSFTPAAGPAGTTVTITGTNFTGASAVTFNGTAAASFTVVSATSVTAVVPAGATTGVIGVTTPSGNAATTNTFTVYPQIDAGSNTGVTSSGGIVWAKDNGTPSLSSATTLTTSVSSFANVPSGVPYQLFQSQRISNGATLSGGGTGFSFTETGVANGTYALNLYFAEPSSNTSMQPVVTGAGQRVFNVLVNGQTVLSDFDIYQTAIDDGATTPQNTVVVESVPVTVSGGQFTVAFQDVTGKALVAAFSLTAPGSAFGADAPAPDWAQDVIPMDDAGSGGAGPSDGISADLASGVEENHPGPDLSVYNPAGPRAVYERMYRSSRALSGYGSPGLAPGWMDDYDYQVTNNSGTYTLTYPDGGTETWSGTTGSLTLPAGLPYLASAPSASTLTMTFKDRSVYTFTLDSGSTTLYRLTGITNVVKHGIAIARDSSHRLLSVVNDASPAVTLLSFTYPSATSMVVTDAYGRFVTLTFGTLGASPILTSVSQIASSGTPAAQWNYTYTPIGGLPFLNTVQTPDPSSPPASGQMTSVYSTATITPNANGTVQQTQDGRPAPMTTTRTLTPMGGQIRLTVSQNPSSPVTDVTGITLYGAQNKATGGIDARNNASSVAYGDPHNLYKPTSVVNRNGQTTTMAYDQQAGSGIPYSGSLSVTTDNRGDVSTLTYQYPSDFALGQLQTSQLTHETNNTTDAMRLPTSYTYYGTGSAFNGLIDTIVSPLPGLIYPAQGTPPATDFVTTTYTYDPALVNNNPLGNVLNVVYPAPNGTAGATEKVAYTYTSGSIVTPSVGEPLTATDANGNVTHFRYDARGNRVTVIDGQGYETDTYYNVADQVQAVAFPPSSGTPTATNRAVEYTTYEYPGGPVENVALYSEGQLTVPTPGMLFPAPSGVTPFRQTVTNYGHEGEVLSVQDLVGTVATYTYDGDYRTLTSADGLGNITGYVYDLRGDLVQEQYPATYKTAAGAVQPSGTTDTETYGYDADQNPLLTVDGRGVVTALVRNDPESLPTDKFYGGLPIQNNGMTLDLTTAPSISGNGSALTLGALPSGVAGIASVQLAYDVWGRSKTMTDGTGTLTMGDPANAMTAGYDDEDRVLLTTKSFTGGPQGQQLTYGYFQDGSLSAITLPGSGQVSNPLTTNGGQFAYAYDPGGRWSKLSVPWPVSSEGIGSTNHFNFLYQNNDWLYYVSGDLGYTRYAFNGRGFVTSLSNLSNTTNNNFGSNISTYSGFTYDAAGNRTGEQMQSIPTDTAFAWDHALAWTYDNRDRLTHEHSAGLSSATVPSAATINYDQYFGYDGADNLTNYKDPMAGQMADFGFNTDNQADNSGFSFDGSGSMLGEASGGLFGGDTLAYDPEERLVSVSNGSSVLLANTYDGAGMRAVKTASDGTVYFLDDASGQPLIEETYSASPTPTATLSVVNAWGADGLRERYTLADGSETSFFYDPQGTLVNRIASVDSGVAVDGEPMTDVSVWDGYGQQRSDQWTNMTVDHQYTPSDPVGFEGQAGYYQDWELAKTSNPATYEYLTTTPSLLTRRYYDASTGRFVSRDPIGYGGGQNLYAYCGGNPVNRKDPNGTQSPVGDGTYEDPWEYLSNGLNHSTPHDWWIAFRYNSVTRAVFTLGDIVSWIPGDPAFDAKVAVKGTEEAVEHGPELATLAESKAGYVFDGTREQLKVVQSDIRRLYDSFVAHGGKIVHSSKAGELGATGEYNPNTNVLYLYKGANLGTLYHELIHFKQFKDGSLIGQCPPSLLRQLKVPFERAVHKQLLESGFKFNE